jgi:CHAT domain-containing protein/TPR repeat protein
MGWLLLWVLVGCGASRSPTSSSVEEPATETSTGGASFLEATVEEAFYDAARAQRKGRFDDAIDLLRKAHGASIRLYGPHSIRTLHIEENLGVSLYAVGDYTQAHVHLRNVYLQYWELENIHPEEVQLLTFDDRLTAAGNFANILFEVGEYADAVELYRELVDASVSYMGPADLDTLNLQLGLAGTLGKAGNLGEAESVLRDVIATSHSAFGTTHPLTLGALSNLGWVLQQSGRSEEAIQWLQLEQRGWEQTNLRQVPESMRAAWILTNQENLATALHDLDRLEEAETTLRESHATSQRTFGEDGPRTVRLATKLSMVLHDQGEIDEALAWAEKAVQHGMNMEIHNPETLRGLSVLGSLLMAAERHEEAIDALARMVEAQETHLVRNMVGTERSLRQFSQTLTESTHLLLNLDLASEDPDATTGKLAIETLVRRKGRVLETQAMSMNQLRRSEDDKELLETYQDLLHHEADWVRKSISEDSAEIQEKLKATRAEIDELEHQLSVRSASFASVANPVTIARVAEQLPENGVLLELAIYAPYDAKTNSWSPTHLAAYTLTADGEIQGKDLGPLSEIEPLIHQFRQTLSDEDAAALYQVLIAPILSDPGSLAHLFISPDGILSVLPFEALQDEEGRVLIDTLPVSYLSTGRDLVRLSHESEAETGRPVVLASPVYAATEAIARRSNPASQRLIGDPVDGEDPSFEASPLTLDDIIQGHWDPLPGTAEEAQTIESVFPDAEVLTETEATAEALRAVDSPRFLHIATHGFSVADNPDTPRDDNPMLRSGLVLSGEEGASLFLASEIAALDLDGTELVVLSACESGLGDAVNGEGVFGMRRALVLAGARSQVMSLWPVDDPATAEFMKGFYGRYAQGASASEALRQTKLEMKSSEHYGETRYWAPFVLAGDWQ